MTRPVSSAGPSGTHGAADGSAGGSTDPGAPGGGSASGRTVVSPRRASRGASLRLALTHTLPAFARGVPSPRPAVTRLLGAAGQPRWSAATLRSLRARHDGAPVLVGGPSGDLLVLLDPADVQEFFARPVRELALDAVDKTRMLSVLEPTGVVCSHGDLRERRRAVNDQVLAYREETHPSWDTFRTVIAEECTRLTTGPALPYARLRRTVQRISRRITLGDQAAGDEELHRWLLALRQEGNWGAVRRGPTPAGRRLYEAATTRLRVYAPHAPAPTLLGRLRTAAAAGDEDVDGVGQAHHWLLALDTVAPIVARTLLLLAFHPAEQAALHEAPHALDTTRLRACVLESLRLHPIVPDLLRILRTDTTWRGIPCPAGTHVLVPIGFLQRDSQLVPGGGLFIPGRWLAEDADHDPRMAPFGHGEGRCPGDRLGLLAAAEVCAQLLREHRVTAGRPRLDPHRPLPGTLESSGIHLTLARA
ncbi:UmuC protein [Streptomyces sp. NBRC 110611]|uniref:cytochrome P450 n=1 Tax=Streptomyces sp. NBRC 110611 TaxID=1621259 RepID=UPI0008373FA9|nr:cytochrome P450 [Streptomyces sp. NBRC 110611]GAU65788.1 UmuC protein [Streptomyces sp. NBRC 110611]